MTEVAPWQLLSLYKLTLIAGITTAVALSLVGAHLAAQARAAQTLCVGQGASLGVLVGMVLVCQFQSDEALASSPWPWIAGLAFAGGIYALGNRLSRESASRNVTFIALFAFLWSLSPLLSGLFPRIDDHLTQVYFGDLVTLSERTAELALGMSLLTLAAFAKVAPELRRYSFNCALTGARSFLARKALRSWRLGAFEALFLVLLCFSIQFLGLLFTLGCLFLPTVLLTRSRTPGASRHLFWVGLASSLGCFGGFFVSLFSSRLSTVPTVLVTLAVVSTVIRRFRQ
jgi:hypothetical protein